MLDSVAAHGANEMHGKSFAPHCGSKTAVRRVPACAQCKKMISKNDAYCGNCGKRQATRKASSAKRYRK